MANATLSILDQNGNVLFNNAIAFNEDSNTQQLMEAAVNQIANDQTLTFGVQYYGVFQQPPLGPLGYLVNMLNGIYDAPNAGVYWEFFYNGVSASTGIDFVFPADGSSIVFRQAVSGNSSSAQIGIKHAFHHGKRN